MVQPAPLAQSAEHSHGKAGVGGSIPPGGSKSRRWSACRGGVAQGQSKRLIIAVSVVRVHPPLPDEVCGALRRPSSGMWRPRCGAGLVGRGRRAALARPRRPVWAPNLGRAPQARGGLGLASSTKHRRTSEADETARPVRPDRQRVAGRVPGRPTSPGIRKSPSGAQPLRRLELGQHLAVGEIRAGESRTR